MGKKIESADSLVGLSDRQVTLLTGILEDLLTSERTSEGTVEIEIDERAKPELSEIQRRLREGWRGI